LGTSALLFYCDPCFVRFSNLAYALVLLFWQPIYAACGFTLYLNRRTHLEGWDIELKFRALRERKIGSAYALCLVPLLLLGSALPSPLLAQEELAPSEKRLLQQRLTSQAAQDDIKAILDAPPFANQETVTRWNIVVAVSAFGW